MSDMTDEHRRVIPVACTLDTSGAAQQLNDWRSLQPACAKVERLSSGVVLWFHEEAAAELRSVVAREAACCQFLDLDLRREGRLLRLEISSESHEAEPVIEALAAQASGI